ncbi:MAG: ATP synthase F1 subunit delta [Acholeplasmatales bacterium]|nr:MAG: ATP synthase F1 subunit delta [Acholeplasmatales bacterium]
MSAVANQYAVALYELALEQAEEDAVALAFKTFVDALDASITAFFLNPRVLKKDKQALLETFKLPVLFSDFLKVVIEHHRFLDLKAMYAAYVTLLETRARIMRVQVTSGRPLGEARIEALKTQYEKKYRRQVLLDNIVDPAIVGGLRFEYDGLVLDDTVNTTLNRLTSRLTR